MKSYSKIFYLFCLLSFVKARAQNNHTVENIEVLSNLKGSSSFTYQSNYNFCKGWHQSTNQKEYSIYNCNDRIYFVEITNPKQPVKVDSVINLMSEVINILTYKKYCYVSTYFFTWIYDLSYLPDSVHSIEYLDFSLERSVFDNNKLYKNNYGNVLVYDFTNPLNPLPPDSLRRSIAYLNQCQNLSVKNDTINASFGSIGFYKINLFNHKFSIIDSIPHPFPSIVSNYNHAFSLDNKTLCTFYQPLSLNTNFYSKQTNGTYKYEFEKALMPSATKTISPKFIGNYWLLVSNNTDGLYTYNVSDIKNIKKTGYFNSFNGINGTGIENYYTDLPSGNILALDKLNGIYVLDAKNAMPPIVQQTVQPILNYHLSVFPNPCDDGFYIQLKRDRSTKVNLFALSGVSVLLKEFPANINDFISTKNITEGSYILKVDGDEGQITQKIIIKH